MIDTNDLKSKIESIYLNKDICSERHLQVYIFNYLAATIGNLELFVEPKIYCESANSSIHGLIPDILITNKNSIVGLIEIKYTPHGGVDYHKDLETFKKFDDTKNQKNTNVYLRVNKVTGDWDYNRPLEISQNLRCYYIVVGHNTSDLFVNESGIFNILSMDNITRIFIKIPIKNASLDS